MVIFRVVVFVTRLGVEITKLFQGGGFFADDDVIEHFDFQQLSGPDQIGSLWRQ